MSLSEKARKHLVNLMGKDLYWVNPLGELIEVAPAEAWTAVLSGAVPISEQVWDHLDGPQIMSMSEGRTTYLVRSRAVAQSRDALKTKRFPAPAPNTLYIVTHAVRLANPDRFDLISPGRLYQDDLGVIRGFYDFQATGGI